MLDVIYDRDYHKDEQRKKERRNRLYEIAERGGYNIQKEYLDYDIEHKGEKLKELTKDIEDGKVKNVIIHSLDRFSRNAIEAWEIIDKINKNDGKCLFINTRLQEIAPQKEIALEQKMIMDYVIRTQKKLMAIKTRFSKGIEFNEELFNTKLKDKQIKLGYLVGYRNKGNIITDNEETLGHWFDEFSLEQLEVKVIPQEIVKDDEDYLNIVVKFAKEIDKDLFRDRLLPEEEDFVEDDEMEM